MADFQGAQIMVGVSPWTGPSSAANFTLCAAVPGILRGQRRTFACAAGPAGAPAGQFIAIWRPSAAKRVLTICEVDAVLGPAVTAYRRPSRGLRRLQAVGRVAEAAEEQRRQQHPLQHGAQ